MIASLLKDDVINHTVLVLAGPQGVGKSTWLYNIIPEELKYDIGITLNFNLLVNVGGKERTYREFDYLLQKSGFEINSVRKSGGIISLIIAEKIKDDKVEEII